MIETLSTEQSIDDLLDDAKGINMLNTLADLILTRNKNFDDLYMLVNYADDSRYAEATSTYYTRASNMNEAKLKLDEHCAEFSTILKVNRITLPLIPIVI